MLWLQQTRPELFQGSLDSPKHVSSVNRRYKRDDLHQLMINHSRSPARRKTRSKAHHNDGEVVQTRPKEGKSKKGHKRYASKAMQHDEPHPSPKPKKSNKKKKASNLKKKGKRTTTGGDKSGGKKKKKNRYSKEESKRVEKYDILGSGNFEIIRGGILDKTNEEKGYKLKSESEGKNRKVKDKKDRTERPVVAVDNAEGGNNNEQTDDNAEGNNGTTEDEDNEPNKPDSGGGGAEEGDFEPFNFDGLFNSEPSILGFQGYDHFDANQNDLNRRVHS